MKPWHPTGGMARQKPMLAFHPSQAERYKKLTVKVVGLRLKDGILEIVYKNFMFYLLV